MNKVLFGAEGVTSMLPQTIVILAVAILAMLCLPRKYVFVPLIVVSMLIPLGQVLMVGSFHFQVTRILVTGGWIRMMIQRSRERDSWQLQLNRMDKAVILYSLSAIVCYTILWQQMAAFTSQLGGAYTVIGTYFFFRYFIRDQEDADRAIKSLIVVAAIIGLFMINEQITGRNVLSIFGGVPARTAARYGYLRSQGPFQVYLTAGAFGASLLPLFLSMFKRNGSILLATVGIFAAMAITLTSKTSTASSAAAAAILGIGMWFWRDYMRLVRWGVIVGLLTAHLSMKAPVWALIHHIDLVGGSTGWHRFKILDDCIKHFFDWWMVGAQNYMFWEGGDDMWDLANQYVLTAESTGLLSLVCFIATIVYAFKYLGRARIAAGADLGRSWYLWLLGVTVFANAVAFMGISYFDQTSVYWYLFLAVVCATTAPATASEPVADVEAVQPEFEWGSPFRGREVAAADGSAGALSLHGG